MTIYKNYSKLTSTSLRNTKRRKRNEKSLFGVVVVQSEFRCFDLLAKRVNDAVLRSIDRRTSMKVVWYIRGALRAANEIIRV